MAASQSAAVFRRLGSAPLLLVALAGLALFAKGFFPVKPLLTGIAEPRAYGRDEGAISAPLTRLVFVVVDALRSDFLLGPDSSMTFSQSLVASGQALPYTAIAQAPTVTLPRLKALTTGSNPTFLDAILNVAEESVSSAVLENVDSWVRQMSEEGKKVVFAGDDTWLRLFPESWFEWSEGVSSFFVSDTVTVDTNITRHLNTLLASRPLPSPYPHDWDVLILHYLGLDHVGHLGGPQSPLMAPKQREMDDVIQRLYEYSKKRDAEDGGRSLLIVVGDHGMTEGGNHGGSTAAETSSALLLASPSFPPTRVLPIIHEGPYKHYEVVQQLDLVPTLSVLFDLGIPTNSMGKLITSAVQALHPSALRNGLLANFAQLSAVVEAGTTGESSELLCTAAEKLGQPCSAGGEAQSDEVLSEFLSASQSFLLRSTALYPPLFLLSGLALLLLSSAFALRSLRPFLRFERPSVKLAVGVALAVWCASCFASSFVEEEHEGWYLLGATGAVVLAMRPSCTTLDRVLLFFTAASIRLMRAWPHNGQKNLPNLSLSHYLSFDPTYTTLLLYSTYAFLLATLLFTLFTSAVSLRTTATSAAKPSTLLAYALSFAFIAVAGITQAIFGVAGFLLPSTETQPAWVEALKRLELGNKVVIARAGYVAAVVGWGVCRGAKRWTGSEELKERYSTLLLILFILFLLPLSRPANAPLFVLFYLQHHTLHRLARRGLLSPLGVAAAVVGWQSVGFFALGGSNALATVDISTAYHGLSSYSLPLVTALTFLSNFSLPILSSLSLHSLLSSAPPASRRFILRYVTAFHLTATASLAASAWWFKDHLFAMTVFAPATLVRGVWLVFVHVGVNLGVARWVVG